MASEFGVLEWSIITTICAGCTFGGVVLWRLADRINKTESRADAAATKAEGTIIGIAAVNLRCTVIENELSEHKVDVAGKMVTTTALEHMEEKLVGAISNLGDRLDKLFMHLAPNKLSSAEGF